MKRSRPTRKNRANAETFESMAHGVGPRRPDLLRVKRIFSDESEKSVFPIAIIILSQLYNNFNKKCKTLKSYCAVMSASASPPSSSTFRLGSSTRTSSLRFRQRSLKLGSKSKMRAHRITSAKLSCSCGIRREMRSCAT